MFDRILAQQSEIQARRAALEGYAISAAAHLAIVGYIWLSTLPSSPLRENDESISFAQFLIPKDQMAGSRPRREHIDWVSTDKVVGQGFVEPKKEIRDIERPKLVVATGTKDDAEAGTPKSLAQPPIALGDSIMTVLEVDTAAVRYDNSAAPAYPENLLRRRVQGRVLVQYVVDTTGLADTASFRVLAATNAEFVQSVRTTLPRMRFHPALMHSRPVRQLVEQPFIFRIVDSLGVSSKRGPGG